MQSENDGYRFLAVGVIEQAFKDACSGDIAALDWLLSEGLSWADCIGVYLEKEQIRNLVLFMWKKMNHLAETRLISDEY